MGETEVEWVGRWWGNTSHLCYSNTSVFNSSHDQVETISTCILLLDGCVEVVGPWCGLKDECSQVGLILPLFDELTWPRWLR